jgi:DNA repair photolyase
MSLSGTLDRPQHAFVDRMKSQGKWIPEAVPAGVVGLRRDLTIYRGERKSKLICHQDHGDQTTYCPSRWWDLRIGSGACGLGCRACFLMLTHRGMRDPLRPLIYNNVEAFWGASRRWLADPRRRAEETLALGIDCCDSLLYEGITEHARQLIPMFADADLNPRGNRLVLLTKSTNTHFLEGLPRAHVVVTFSLNPEPVADLWEGKWPDTLERITPPVTERLKACLLAQKMGFETRWRLDPILTPPGWQKLYAGFLEEAAGMGLRPSRITLGTYREKTRQLDTWRRKWGLPEMEWEPDQVVKDGTHFHVPSDHRLSVYRTVGELCERSFPESERSLCKETYSVRRQLAMCDTCCNCLP